MDTRFERRLLKAKNPRLRKHNAKPAPKLTKPASHVDAFLNELSEDIKSAPIGAPFWNQHPYAIEKDVASTIAAPLTLAEGLAISAAQDGIDAIKRKLKEKEKEEALAKRRTYYAAEAAVRQAKRDQLEQSRPAPQHPCPTPAELIEAYNHRHESEEWKVRFGTLMIDLEEHVRRTYVHVGNKFSGSAGGVKEWLARECPTLARHYSTCLRFKRKLQDDPDIDSGT